MDNGWTMKDKISKLAFNIVTNFLNIKKDDAISIYTEIFDQNYEQPLLEIPLMEELAVAVRKRKAFPILEVTTQNLQKRFFNELSEEILGIVPKYFIEKIDLVTAFLEIGWKALGNPFEKLNISSKIFYQTVYAILEKIYEKDKKIIYLNFPSEQLATYTNTNLEELLQAYFTLINCDYNKLKKTAEEIKFFFETNDKIIIKTQGGNLKFLINNNETKIFGNGFKNALILPTGKAEVPIKKLFLNGNFFAEQIYYKNKIYKNATVTFNEGFIQAVNIADSTSKDVFEMKNNLIGSKEECYFSIGFNEKLDNFTNFYSYDRNIKNAVSLKFFDHSLNPILLINKTNENNIEGV